MKELVVENKKIKIYYNENNNSEEIPIIILNVFDENKEEIWNLTKCKNYILVTISNINWNAEMSPWFMEKMYKNDTDYLGNADEYIKLLDEKIIPQIDIVIEQELKKKNSFYMIAGYSLAGLFAIYCMYQTDKFKRVGSISGSLWYPNFLQFAKENELKYMPEKIYFSLGNKEEKTKNEKMAKVKENTLILKEYYAQKEIDTIYEENEGNHFQDVSNRIAKGICWLLT